MAGNVTTSMNFKRQYNHISCIKSIFVKPVQLEVQSTKLKTMRFNFSVLRWYGRDGTGALKGHMGSITQFVKTAV